MWIVRITWRGTATVGDYGNAAAGELSRLSILYFDGKAERYREIIGYAGEDGIEPNVTYKLDETTHTFVKV